MEIKYSQKVERNFILIIALIFLILTFFVVKDIFALIVYSLILSYFLHPTYKYFLTKINNKKISSILTLSSFTLIIFIPTILLFYFLILNLVKLIVEYKVYIENPEILNDLILEFSRKITDSPVLASLNLTELLKSLVVYIVDFSTNFFSSIPKVVIYFFIVLFITYYLLIYNKEILKVLNEYVPMTLKKQENLLRSIEKNLKTLFRGYFLTGIIQTAVAVLGYIIFGAPNILIITFLTLITSLIPYLGTPLVWVPVGFYMILTGHTGAGIGLIIYGVLIISMVDNFLRPILMSNKETISPPLVFIGFVGGLVAFGLIGIILGPIIISITSILLKYVKELYEIKD